MPEIFSSIVAAELAEAVALALDAALIGDGDDGVGVGIVGHAPLRALFSYRLRVAFAWFAHCFCIVFAVSSAQFCVQCYARSAV